MRFLRITAHYPAYLRQFYSIHAAIAAQPYDAQYAALMQDGFWASDSWAVALREYGYETAEIVANAEPLQRQWAREHLARIDEGAWFDDVLAAQVSSFRPDVLFVGDYPHFQASLVRRLTAETPSLRLVIVWCGAPYSDASLFQACDVVLSCVPELVDQFRAAGHRSYHLNHAFDPRILERINRSSGPSIPFSFVGQVVKGGDRHDERERLLRAVLSSTDIQVYSDVNRLSASEWQYIRPRKLASDALALLTRCGVPNSLWERIPTTRRLLRWRERTDLSTVVNPLLGERARSAVYGLAMYQTLRDSKVSLNCHIDISRNSASNMRLYEATGVSSCLLTDWKKSLPDLFVPDEEVVAYRSADECIEKAMYLLSHENERLRIAAAGNRRTLRDHTFAQRAGQMDAIIRQALIR